MFEYSEYYSDQFCSYCFKSEQAPGCDVCGQGTGGVSEKRPRTAMFCTNYQT